MTMIKQDSNVIIDTAIGVDHWAAFEVHATLTEGAPPEIIYVNACKLHDVYKLTQARINSEFARMFANGGMVMVHIIATGNDRREIIEYALRHQKSLPLPPRCNVVGHLMTQAHRIIICSNGKEYKSQTDAALALGVAQSAISRHLRGDLATVKGYTLSYKV